ncbi:MAG: hypothetical protein K6B75_00495 [Lachnospiraceae bacterium]|nr:hypothetical protein [Lachnospiraceae bacterium]
MKRLKRVLIAGLVLVLAGCGVSHITEDGVVQNNTSNTSGKQLIPDDAPLDDPEPEEDSYVVTNEDGIVDITVLSPTMVYAQVLNILMYPEEYVGRTVKMNGEFSVYEDTANNVVYFACIIKDATACCAQGIEFKLEGDHVYPDDFPAAGTNVTVTGVFEPYEENGNLYACLVGSAMEY